MSDQDQLLACLNTARDELLAAIEGLTDQQAAVKPQGGGWSALELVEHVAIAESRMLWRISTQSAAVRDELSREREPVLYARLATREQKFQAPEPVRPKGGYATLGEAVDAFLDARYQTLKWLESCDIDLRRHKLEHPAIGPASAYEYVLIMAAHTARHARQIQEGRVR